MAIRVINKQKRLRVDGRALGRLVARILSDHSHAGSDVTVVLADDDFVRELNREYRGVDRRTDVLAFGEDPVPEPSDADAPEVVLGDVVVSTERAAVQARRFRRPVELELLKLVAHGVLHLLGYDHEEDGEQREMRRLENRYAREAHAALAGRARGSGGRG